MNILIFANAIHRNTLTGGDKVFVEYAKRWIRWGHVVTIVTNEAGRQYCISNGLAKKYIILWHASWTDRYGVYSAMLTKTISSFLRGLLFYPKTPDIIFASSFFLPDITAAFIMKLRYKKARLVTASYLFTKNKWGSDYSGGKIKGLLFYINEVLASHLMRRYGGITLTASPYDRDQLIRTKHSDERKIMAVRGGVDTKFFSSVLEQPIRYDAVFVGRFHPQKCLDELIAIWGMVIARNPRRILALVGGGPLNHKLRTLVLRKNMENNVFFLGIHDGIEKAEILKSSRLFLSASRYDSGNIALDEALSCGIPGIVYDLPALDYPMGVVKIPTGNQPLFADSIETLLSNEEKRIQLGEDALVFSRTLDWNKKARDVLSFIRHA